MARLELPGGFYVARSIIANAQRCVNLYPEANPEGSPTKYTLYPTPGSTTLSAGAGGSGRGLYTASNGDLYAVEGQTLYYIDSTWTRTALLTLSNSASTPVVLQDNGNVIVVVDGSLEGWAIDLSTRQVGLITSPYFYGATRVDYIDSFFVLNRVGTRQFYWSLSNVTFDDLTGTVGEIYSGALSTAGSGYTDGVYASVPMTGGTGSGALLDITVAGGVVSAASLADGGSAYTLNDPLRYVGNVLGFYTGNIQNAGSLYTDGTYTNVSLTNGSGSGIKATIVIAGGVVSSVTPTDNGNGNYVVGDTLGVAAASVGGTGSGFIYVLTAYPKGFIWGVTGIHGGGFDGLDTESKTGYPDPVATLIVMHSEIWLLGNQASTEVWYDAAADSQFQRVAGVFIEQGAAAPYSVAKNDLAIFWLGVNKSGIRTVFMGQGYQAKRISTPALAAALASYASVSDAIGMTYMQEDHAFYVLTFPSANATWVYDISEGLWHERAWNDPDNGTENRIRANGMAFAYGVNVAIDWEDGSLYAVSLDALDDSGDAIVRRRGFPHIVADGFMSEHVRFTLDMQAGESSSDDQADALVNLRWSDDRGRTWGTPLMLTLGAQGEYETQPDVKGLGVARDRVYEVFWSSSVKTALNGAWIDTVKSGA